MNKASNEIEQVGRTWKLTQDALALVRREVARQGKGTSERSVLARTNFEDLSLSDAQTDLQSCQKANEDFAILAMWTIFERRLVLRLEEECRKIQDQNSSEFNRVVFKKIVNTVEYWKIDDALDLIKPLVGSDLAGSAKNIKKYRDWIVHRNPRKPTPATVDAQYAKEILKLISDALERA